MLKFTLLLARKDLRLLLFRSGGLIQGLLLGLLLIFIFSLASAPGEKPSAETAATIFWLSSIFCQILIFTQLYALEETNGIRDGLLLTAPIQGVWLGKTLSGAILLLISQLFFLPSIFVFLQQEAITNLWLGFCSLILTDVGICTLGSLLGAVSQCANGRESLISIIMFPLLIPLLLGAISLGSASLGATQANISQWLWISCSFDFLFLGAGLLLFAFIYQEWD